MAIFVAVANIKELQLADELYPSYRLRTNLVRLVKSNIL